jgi:hypothetical protein
MKNKIRFQLVAVIFVIIAAIYTTGCQQSTQTTYSGNLKGYVYDSLGRAPINLVKITCPDVNLSGYTNEQGLFIFNNIDMPRSEVNFNFTFEKGGYKKAIYVLTFKSDVTTTIDSVFMVRDTLK